MRRLGAVAALLALSAGQAAELRVSLHAPMRGALPPAAELEMALLDLSGQELPVRVIGRLQRRLDGPPPWMVRLHYDPAQVQAGRPYQLRAGVAEGRQVLLRSSPPLSLRLDGSDPPAVLQLRPERP